MQKEQKGEAVKFEIYDTGSFSDACEKCIFNNAKCCGSENAIIGDPDCAKEARKAKIPFMSAAFREVPPDCQHHAKDRALMNADGTRSIFDDIDACESCGYTPAQRQHRWDLPACSCDTVKHHISTHAKIGAVLRRHGHLAEGGIDELLESLSSIIATEIAEKTKYKEEAALLKWQFSNSAKLERDSCIKLIRDVRNGLKEQSSRSSYLRSALEQIEVAIMKRGA